MKIWAVPSSFFALLLIAVITLACGSSAPRVTQSLSITPLTADANDFPNGQVPYTATAYYSRQPSPVKGVQATWGACFQNTPTSNVTVSANGMAQCVAGASGTYTVWAFVLTDDRGCPNLVNACGGGGCQVTGTAALTCP